MTDADFAQAQRLRDEQTLIDLYEQRAQAQACKRSYDDELERAQSALNRATARSRVAAIALETAERVLELHLDAIVARSASISPIQRLPAELLVQIFSSSLNHIGISSRCKRSFVLASVCHRWRKLALSSPRLWSIHLDFERRAAHVAEYVKAVLARSGNIALRITIFSPGMPDADLMHTLDNVLPAAITCAGDLTITRRGEGSQNVSDTIYKFLQLPTPQLRRLCIAGFEIRAPDARFLPAAPIIATLECNLGGFPEAFLLSLHEISLLLQYELPDLSLLHATAPHLRRLRFKRHPDRRIIRVSKPATLPYLEFLELDGIDILSIFPHDGLPSMTRLSLRSLRARGDESLPLPAMPLLREMMLHDSSDWLSILPFFRQLQQVETLVIPSRTFVMQHMRDFSIQWAQRNRVDALPNLRNITIHGTDVKPTDKVPGLLELLEARAAQSADDTTTPGKLHLLTLRNTALPRWELLRLESAVERIAFVDD